MNPHLLSTSILVAHWLIVVGLSLRVITRRSPVGVSVAWIAVMFSVPFMGAAIYLLFGEKRLGRRRAARTAKVADSMRRWQDRLRQKADVRTASLSALATPLNGLAETVLGFPAQGGNSIELLDHYEAIFDALVADIDGSRESCHLSFYVWHGHGRAIDVVDALVRAAKRGVDCRAIGDALGSKAFLQGGLVDSLRNAGGVLPRFHGRFAFGRRAHRTVHWWLAAHKEPHPRC